MTKSGIYRRQCRGVVLSTRPTVIGMVDFLDCSGSRRERRSRRRMDRTYELRGHYVAKIAADDGEIYKISISGRDFEAVQPGQYVVCEPPGGSRVFFQSKEAAAKTPPSGVR